jgi:hypothetical protein
MGLHALHAPAVLAGLSGALLAALWNYSAASTMAWGGRAKVAPGRKGAPLTTARLAIKPD